MTACAAPRRHAEAGAIGLLTLLAGVLCAGVCLVLIVVATDAGVAAARARTAADAAALAAAGASPLAGGDGDARSAAGRLAAVNGARLVSCCSVHTDALVPGIPEAVVVEVEVPLARTGFGSGAVAIRARAAATLRPTDVPRAALR